MFNNRNMKNNILTAITCFTFAFSVDVLSQRNKTVKPPSKQNPTVKADTPAKGEAARPARGGATRPARGEAARPPRGEAARPARGEAARPARGGAARPARGDAARPAGKPTLRNQENPAEGEERAHILEKLHRIEVLIKEHAGSSENEEPHERQIRKIVAELMEKAR